MVTTTPSDCPTDGFLSEPLMVGCLQQNSVRLNSGTSQVNEKEWETLTHISIWNSQQHTGRISLASIFEDLQYKTTRRTKGEWSFDDFRNVLKDRGPQFLMDIFNNYALISATAGDKGWYDKELLEDKYFVIRFEYDNQANKELILHQTNIQVLKSNR